LLRCYEIDAYYTIILGSCSKCKNDKALIQTAGINKKGGKNHSIDFNAIIGKEALVYFLDEIIKKNYCLIRILIHGND